MSVFAQAAGPAPLPGRLRAVLAAWTAALASQREQEKLWQATVADAHALAERGRAMGRDAVRGPYLAAATLHTVLPTSSATTSAPLPSMATPTGLP